VVAVIWFTLLIFATGLERLWELVVSTKNARKAFAAGGVEHGKAHFPAMVLLHTGLLVGALAEVWLLQREFPGALGWLMLLVALGCQFGRYLVIYTLGEQWNTRIIVVPGRQKVSRGIYSLPWLRHPNYWIVAIEGIALPMVHGAWITALSFTVLNAILLLGFRIPAEDKALESLRP
jgi:methyltransferase